MRASKENCDKALEMLTVLCDSAPKGVPLDQVLEAELFLRQFLKACRGRLPYQSTYDRHNANRRKGTRALPAEPKQQDGTYVHMTEKAE